MTTIYTFNSKVLKNTVNDKWLIKKIIPLDEVTIGNQIWKNKNLAIDDGQGGIYTQTVNYGQGNVVEYYYTWDAAVRIANSISGWHLPTQSDWSTLATTVGGTSNAGTKFKSTYGWEYGNGTDDYGLSLFPAGHRYSNSFFDLGSYAYYWTVTTKGSNRAYYCYFDTGTSMSSNYNSRALYAYSVRLIKD